MQREKKEALTYMQALDSYFGGIHQLNKQTLPFKCQCGKMTTKIDKKEVPMLTVPDCFVHIRKEHGEKIRQPKKVLKTTQATI